MPNVKLTYKANKAYFTGISKKYKEVTEDLLVKTINNIESEAVQAAPADKGFLRNSAYSEIEGLEGVVGFKAEYAPFMEFGTGVLVNVPAEWSQYAKTFQNQNLGSFEDFKTSIRDWMRSKGIEEQFLYPIMLKILRVGVAPQPFLHPAWRKNSDKFLKELRKIVKNGVE